MRAQKFAFVAVLVLCLLPGVFSIGVSPARVQVEFIPGHTYDFVVKVINYNNFPIEAEVRTTGDLKSGFSVQQPIRLPAVGSAMVPISFTLPTALDAPGYHTQYIFFKESFKDPAGGSFPVLTEVGMRIVVWQPYPGHYAEISAAAENVGEGNDSKMTVFINNFGTEPVVDGKATVRVVSASKELKDVFTWPQVNVDANSNKQFVDIIPSHRYAPGKYYLESRLEYGANVSNRTTYFIVGTQDVDINALEGPLYLDKPVNKYDVHVESLWNLPIDNVYATLELGTSTSKTPSIALGGFGKGVLEGYWETDNTVKAGSTLGHVIVYFPGGQKEALLPITVFNTTPSPITAQATKEEPAVVLSLADLIFMLIAIVIVGCLVLFAVTRLRKKEEKTPSPEKPVDSPTPSEQSAQPPVVK